MSRRTAKDTYLIELPLQSGPGEMLIRMPRASSDDAARKALAKLALTGRYTLWRVSAATGLRSAIEEGR